MFQVDVAAAAPLIFRLVVYPTSLKVGRLFYTTKAGCLPTVVLKCFGSLYGC